MSDKQQETNQNMGLKGLWYCLLVSIQFLTILPIHRHFYAPYTTPNYSVAGGTLNFYPLVGGLIGIILMFAAWGINTWNSGFDTLLAAALILVLWVFLTGGLHLDGLADSADAWMGGLGNREKTLAIMKDPACGPIAVIALVLVLLLKWLLLAQLLSLDMLWLLLVAPVLARLLVMALVIYTPYVRLGGIGSELKHQAQTRTFWLQLLVVATVLMLLGGWLLLVALVATALLGIYLRTLMMQRLGGWTGDTAGAFIELVELMVLLLVSLGMTS